MTNDQIAQKIIEISGRFEDRHHQLQSLAVEICQALDDKDASLAPFSCEKLREHLLQCDKIAWLKNLEYGLCDSLDNHGKYYQSQGLEDTLKKLKAPKESGAS